MWLREGVCNKNCSGLLQVEKKILKADPLASYVSNSFFLQIQVFTNHMQFE